MQNLELFQTTGYALELLSQSDYHQHFDFDRYFCREILPPLQLGQAKFYIDNQGIPAAMVTWAWLTEKARDEIHTTGRALCSDEWNEGEHLFFNDFIAPYGHARDVIKDLARTSFPNHVASSISRNPDRSIRKINHWTRELRVKKAKSEIDGQSTLS